MVRCLSVCSVRWFDPKACPDESSLWYERPTARDIPASESTSAVAPYDIAPRVGSAASGKLESVYRPIVLRSARTNATRGQTLVEFALVLPLFILLLLGVVEFSFMFNATLGINFASRNASLVAAESGSSTLADCAILARIERDITASLIASQIQTVKIYRADRAGNPVPNVGNDYTRTGSMACVGYTPSSVPYTLGAATYPMGEAPTGGRCDILAGCSSSIPIPLDSIGVKITYRYVLKTPLLSFLPGAAAGYLDFTWSNVMRMEPIL